MQTAEALENHDLENNPFVKNVYKFAASDTLENRALENNFSVKNTSKFDASKLVHNKKYKASSDSHAYSIIKPERYYSGTKLGLEPQPDYGKIYPYLGQINESVRNNIPEFGGLWPAGYLYGFINENSQIICDPFYEFVDYITFDNKTLYLMRKFTRNEEYLSEYGYTYRGSWTTTEWSTKPFYISCVDIAAEDGSFVLRFDDVFYPDDCTGYLPYIPVCRDGKWGIIDFNGNEKLPCEYVTPPIFSNGVAPVFSDETMEYYHYINLDGEVVGETIIIPKKDPSIYYYYSSSSSLQLRDNRPYDDEFNVIYSQIFSDIWYGKNNNHSNSDTNSDSSVFIDEGNLIGEIDFKYEYVYDNWLWVPEYYDADKNKYSGGSFKRGTVSGNRYGVDNCVFRFAFALSDEQTTSRFGIMAKDGVLLDAEYEYLKGCNGYFLARKNYYGGLIDVYGNWIIKVSLLDSMAD